MQERIRSFIAIDIDDDKVLDRITKAQEALTEVGGDLKLVEPQNIHITIRFLGDIFPEMAEKVHEAMKGTPFPSFDVELKGMGAFPSLKHMNVIWIGIDRGADEIERLFNQLEPKLRKLGFVPDRKGFSPHLTIARVKSGRHKNELAKQIMTLSKYEFGTMTANTIRLKKSVLTPKGPVYSTIREVRATEKP